MLIHPDIIVLIKQPIARETAFDWRSHVTEGHSQFLQEWWGRPD